MRAHFEKQEEEEIIWFVFPRPSVMMNDLFTEFHVLLYIKLPSVKMDWIDKISSYSIRQKKTLQRDRMCITKCILSSFFDNGNRADDNRSHHNRIPGISPMARMRFCYHAGEKWSHTEVYGRLASRLSHFRLFSPNFPFMLSDRWNRQFLVEGGGGSFLFGSSCTEKWKKKRRDTRTPSNNVFL
jgi:hypothetical protein